MTYQLGIDLGTTYTAAAVRRNGQPEIVDLGLRTPSIPSVVFVKEGDEVLTGDAANRRGIAEPSRVARQFKRRIGDTTPLLLGGAPYSPQAVAAKLLSWVTETVRQREGERPDEVVVCHPANWGEFKRELLDQAVRLADLDDATPLTEPEAAAVYYSARERVGVGEIVAVYDLGGGTFDAAVLRRTEDGFEIIGEPEGVEHLGGIDFDEAVLGHVREALGGKLDELDLDDPATRGAVAQLRQYCVEAKETLSSDTDAAVLVVLPDITTEVRITRAEFEDMIRPSIAETIASLRRALASAGVSDDDVATVLLVGGSSRIPLIAQMVGAEIGRPIAVDAHPKHSVALGAALHNAGERAHTVVVPSDAGSIDAPTEASSRQPVSEPDQPPPTAPPIEPPPPRGRPRGGRLRFWAVTGVVVAVIVAAVAFTTTQGGDGDAAATDQPITTIDVGNFPRRIAVDADAAWVTNSDDDTVSRIDPDTNEVVATIDVSATPHDVVTQPGQVWVTHAEADRVSRIDPDTNTVVAAVRVVSAPEGAAIGGGSVWVASPGSDTVSRIDPATDQVVATIDVGGEPLDVAADDEAVWVTNGDGDTVSRIDPDTNEVVATIDVGDLPQGVAIGFDAVWVSNVDGNSLSRIDPGTNAVVATIDVGDLPRVVTVDDDAVWVSSVGDDAVFRIDPETNDVVDTVGVGDGPQGVDAESGSVWVADNNGGTVTRIVPGLIP